MRARGKPRLINTLNLVKFGDAGLEEAQAGIKIAGRNIKNLRYADDTTLMAESEEKLKSFFMKMNEESEKVTLKLRELRSQHPFPSLHGK